MTLELAALPRSEPHTHAIRFVERKNPCAQNEECCEVYLNNRWRRVRLHDYAAIYGIPGLYEQLFAVRLRCISPERVVQLFGEVLEDAGQAPTDLRVLDLGAGNGMVGQELRTQGVQALVGIDILPEAAQAAERDRPGLYDDYLAADLCNLQRQEAHRVLSHRPNCLVSVAALGFGDIPPTAFATAFNLVSTPAWIVFNIKETFLSGIDDTGFSRLIRTLCDQEYMQIQAYRRYPHRLSVAGQRLFYVAMVARKLRAVPDSIVEGMVA